MVLGVYGLIGSGKSTVTAYLREQYGFQVIDADVIGKQVMRSPRAVALVKARLPMVVDEHSGLINNDKLRQVLFTNPELNKVIQEEVWPEIGATINEQVRAIPNTNVVVESAMLTQLQVKVDYWLRVDSDGFPTNVERVRQRDQRAAHETESVLRTQQALNANSPVDAIVRNDRDHGHLYAQLDQLIAQWQEALKNAGHSPENGIA